MTQYKVLQDYQLPADANWENPWMAGAHLEEGEQFVDGEIEPDIVASLVSKGIIEPVGVAKAKPVARVIAMNSEIEEEDD